MPKQPPRRAASDTLRLKREIAHLDSTFRAHGRAFVRADNAAVARTLDKAARQAFTTSMAKTDTLNMVRRATPKNKKLYTNHAAHGDEVTFAPSMRTRAQRKWGS